MIGREKLVAIRAEIKAIDKLDSQPGLENKKNEEGKYLAGALLDAESRMIGFL